MKTTGLIPQPFDERDLHYTDSIQIVNDVDSVDLRAEFPPIENQGTFNSCTSHAVGDLMNYFLATKKKYAKWNLFNFSKAYLWYYSRKRLGKELKNNGAILRDCFKVITNEGFVKTTDWDFSKPYQEPSYLSRIASKFYKLYLGQLPSYYRLSNNKEAIWCLQEGLPFVFGFPVTSEFTKIKRGEVYKHNPEFIQTGLHAMLVVGFNDKGFIVRNSWGERWGDKGYCVIDFDNFEQYSFDKWTLK